jgi:hypothetical protein
MQPEPVVRVTADSGLEHPVKQTGILLNIPLYIPGTPYRNLVAEEQPMLAWGHTDQKGTHHRAASPHGQQCWALCGMRLDAKKLDLHPCMAQAALIH